MKKSKKTAKHKKTPEEIVNDIQEACKLLGWNLAMNESSPGIRGLVIGQPDFVEEVISSLEDSEDFAIYAASQTVQSEMH